MKELNDFDKQKALLELMTKLNDSKRSVAEEGTVSIEELEEQLFGIKTLSDSEDDL